MPQQQLYGNFQIVTGTIQRPLLDIATPGLAVVRKVTGFNGLFSASSGVDEGTGDVSIGLSSYPVIAGTWTPTLFSGTNTQTLVANLCNYIQVSNQVFINGSLQIDTGAIGAFTCYMSLPIASNFNASTDANGNGTQPGAGTPNIFSIREDQANNRLQIDGYAQVNTNLFYRFAGGYIVK